MCVCCVRGLRSALQALILALQSSTLLQSINPSPPFVMTSPYPMIGLGIAILALTWQGYDPLALEDGLTPVEDNVGLLETRVTATNLSPELLMLGQFQYFPRNVALFLSVP
ncbi:hypothetical protein Tco_0085167 [Tanacetum coccineum]